MISVLTLVAALLAPQQSPAPGTVRGTIVAERTGEALAGAVVELRGRGGVERIAEADSVGAYVLRRVPAGDWTLRARRVDYAPLAVDARVPAGGELILDLALERRPVPLRGVSVRASPDADPVRRDDPEAPDPEIGPAGVRALEATPGMAEVGMPDAQGRPGHEPADPTDVLYVRGAATELKRVLVDGAPVYTPFHLAGLLQPFEEAALGGTTFHRGGAPARYDGGLSYVLDLRSRPGRRDATHGSGAVDLLSAGATVEGPLGGRGGYLASGRAVHPFGVGALWDPAFPYAYEDALVRMDVDAGAPNALRATAFWNREAVRLDDWAGRATEGVWGNLAASTRYRGSVFGSDAEFSAAFGRFDARLPMAGDDSLLAAGGNQRIRLAADLARDVGAVRLKYGAAAERLRTVYDIERGTRGVAESPRSVDLEGGLVGVYVDGGWQPAPQWRIRGGARLDAFGATRSLRVAPRLTVTWAMTDRAALTLAGGRYHQYARPADPFGETASTADTAGLGVAGASHLLLRVDQAFADATRFGLEGYLKRFENVPAADAGRANASGVDLWLRHGGDGVDGWLGYSLEWVWTPLRGGVSDRFAGRQLLSAGLAGPLGESGAFDLRVGYGAGLPYTAIQNTTVLEAGDFDGPGSRQRAPVEIGTVVLSSGSEGPDGLGAAPDEPFLRVDAEVAYRWTVDWAGTDVRVAPFLKVLNALSRRDAMFYRVRVEAGREPQPVGALPLLPVLGVRWRF